MNKTIKILCPGRKCGKCRRMIQRVEEAVNISGVEAEIEIIDSIDEMINYRTWILPTLVINNKIIARGYVPTIEQILNFLNVNTISNI